MRGVDHTDKLPGSRENPFSLVVLKPEVNEIQHSPKALSKEKHPNFWGAVGTGRRRRML